MTASKLIRPDLEHLESYLEALGEYHDEGRLLFQTVDRIKADAKGFVDALRAESGYPHQPYDDWVEPVPETILWMVKDGKYIGTVAIRHRLNWHLEKWGGHLSYVVRPSMRGKGFGKKLLQKAIPYINYLGIDKALITCALDNTASQRVIEFCGGVLEDETPETDKFPARKRFWLDCT